MIEKTRAGSKGTPAYSKHKYSCVKHEELEENKDYAFSFNPDPVKTKDNGEVLFKQIYTKMYRLLGILKGSYVKVYPEASPSGKIHFHGTLLIMNYQTFCLIDLPLLQLHGTYEIDHLDDTDCGWFTYCTKQQSKWFPYCHKRRMKYCISNVNSACLMRETPEEMNRSRKELDCLDVLEDASGETQEANNS